MTTKQSEAIHEMATNIDPMHREGHSASHTVSIDSESELVHFNVTLIDDDGRTVKVVHPGMVRVVGGESGHIRFLSALLRIPVTA